MSVFSERVTMVCIHFSGHDGGFSSLLVEDFGRVG